MRAYPLSVPFMPALRALSLQMIAAALTVALLRLGVLAPFSLLDLAAIQGCLAATLALISRAPPWWLPIHLFFLPAAVLAHQTALPTWFWAIAFIVLALIYWSCFITRVPLFLSNTKTIELLAHSLPEGPLRVLDIGSGTGSFVRGFARLRPDAEVHGIEAAPAPALLGRWLARAQRNVHLSRGDFFASDWSDFDVIYAFLSPAPMAKVWEKACQELRPGTVLISNSFAVPDQQEAGVLDVADRRRTRLYCYTLRSAPTAPLRHRIWPTRQTA